MYVLIEYSLKNHSTMYVKNIVVVPIWPFFGDSHTRLLQTERYSNC